MHIQAYARHWQKCLPGRPLCVHAFGEGRPQRDLILSPNHAIYADGVLIPVRYLLNGATIPPVAMVVAQLRNELQSASRLPPPCGEGRGGALTPQHSPRMKKALLF